jgi:hypothetical protein
MQDFKVMQSNSRGAFDLVIDEENRRYASVEGFETAIDYQLFVNKRAGPDDVQIAENRQGWIGDLATKGSGYESGSLVWLKEQSRNTQVDKNELAEFVRDSMNYFIDIGAVNSVNLSVVSDSIVGTLSVAGGNNVNYSRLWRATNADNN